MFRIVSAAIFMCSLSLFAADGASYNCRTKVIGSYYVMTEMKVTLATNASELFVQPKGNTGSTGSKTKVDPDTGYVSFKGFSSEDMFGPLAEASADRGIYVYVSPEMIKGENGRLSLYARGSEIGFEAATYTCSKI